ncbi:MAG: DUF924 domain-containing protein [Hyphomicrobiales bacterium]|nr:MAG: DUF924 domain-containing protein [Hyphomicrobiales bacterium]
MDKIEAGWVDAVLDFWFGKLTYEDWFSGGPELDEAVRARFLPLYEALKAGFDEKAVGDARTALAAILVFDQFPRNIFRGEAAAFATDDLAAGIARLAVERGWDEEAEPARRPFYYMPFMHSEILADQERCVDLFRGIGEGDGLKYAVEHRDIVARFGRFPHRNRALGRPSTPAELEFMKEHAGYGQS